MKISDLTRKSKEPDELLASQLISQPYFIVDAWIERGLRSPEFFHNQRYQLSNGSARYLLSAGPKTEKDSLGWLELTAMTATATILEVTMHTSAVRQDSDARESLRYFLVELFTRFVEVFHTGEFQKLNLNPQTIETLTRLILKPDFDPREPKHGDTIDTWLDWRETERRRGRRGRYLTLEHIAKEGGFSLSTLKKRSAERTQRADESTEELK